MRLASLRVTLMADTSTCPEPVDPNDPALRAKLSGYTHGRPLRKDVADMADYFARKICAADFTLSEYLEERVAEWYRGYRKHRFPLLEWLGMTADEYAEWVTHGGVSHRVQSLQVDRYILRVLRGHR